MRQAYGKFDPELNPPPFSDWSKTFTSVEIDLFEYFSWKPKVRSYFESWVKRKSLGVIPRMGIRTERAAAEYRESLAAWRERFNEETLYVLIHSGRKEWTPQICSKEISKLDPSEKYFFEWGKGDSSNGVEFIPAHCCFQGWVVDPDWHSTSLASLNGFDLHFKLHGWSEERWIRRYGAAQSARILRAIKNRAGSILTLSYSGKVAEAPLFFGSVSVG